LTDNGKINHEKGMFGAAAWAFPFYFIGNLKRMAHHELSSLWMKIDGLWE